MASARTQCSREVLTWSKAEIGIDEIVTDYKTLLPFPVIIKDAQTVGGNDFWSASPYDVFWARTVIDHLWVIVQDEQGNRYKIPECYDAMVIPVTSDGREGTPFPFCDVRERGEYRYIKFVSGQREFFDVEQRKRRIKDFAALEVVDVYNDSFLVVHPLHMQYIVSQLSTDASQHVIDSRYKMLPSSLPIRVSLGTGLKNVPDELYFHIMAELKALADQYQENYIFRMKQSAVINTDDLTSSDDDYERIEDELVEKNEATSQLGLFPSRDTTRTRMMQLQAFYRTGCLNSVGGATRATDACERPGPGTRPDVTQSAQPDEKDAGVTTLKRMFDALSQRQADASRPPHGPMIAPRKRQTTAQVQALGKQLGDRVPAGRLSKGTPPKPQPRGAVPGLSPAPGLRGAVPELSPAPGLRGAVPGLSPAPGLRGAVPGLSPAPGLRGAVPGLSPAPGLRGADRNKPTSRRFASLRDVPADVSRLSVEDVGECLRLLDMPRHAEAMTSAQVDGSLLLALSEAVLRQEFHFTDFEANKLRRFVKNGWRPTDAEHWPTP